MLEWVWCQMRLDECLRKEDDVIWIWILASLIGSLFAQLGGKTSKYLGFSHSCDAWKKTIIGHGSQGAQHL